MSPLVPYFSYRDAAAAIEWLEQAFGFRKLQAFEGPDGRVMHAEMAFEDGVIMLGSGDPPAADAARAEDESPAAHGVYVVVEDVDAHHGRAAAAGARIVYEPQDTEFGTRRYRALDPEGYEWSFGTYRPGG
jgi:uncharacterized glyoxalase superfamily protein PhnB